MNRYFLILIAVAFNMGYMYCQVLQDSIWIIPENPTATDSVYLITDIVFTSGTYFLESDIKNDLNGDVTIRDCYYKTDAAVLSFFQDTFNLGVRDIGIYNVEYKKLVGIMPGACLPVDSSALQTTFEVSGPNLAVNSKVAEITCFPNPFNGEHFSISSKSSIQTIFIIDIHGHILQRIDKVGINHARIDTRDVETGTYFVRIVDVENRNYLKKIVKL